MNNPSSRLATIYGFLALACWSTTIAFGSSLAREIGAFNASAIVYFFGGLISILFFKINKAKPVYFSLSYLLTAGIFFILHIATIYLAYEFASSENHIIIVASINYLWSVFTVLLSIPVLKAKAKPVLLIGVLFALTGLFFVMFERSNMRWTDFTETLTTNKLAYFLSFICAIFWALHCNFSRLLNSHNQKGAVPYFMLATGIVLFICSIIFPQEINLQTSTVFRMLYMIFAVTSGFILWDIAVHKGNFILISTCSYFLPFMATIVLCIFYSITPGWKLWFGCLLLITGAFISNKSIFQKSNF